MRARHFAPGNWEIARRRVNELRGIRRDRRDKPIHIPFNDDGMAHKQREVELPFSETELTKGQARKLNALRISVGGDLAEKVFDKRLKRQVSQKINRAAGSGFRRERRTAGGIGDESGVQTRQLRLYRSSRPGTWGVRAQRSQEYRAHMRRRRT